MYYRGVHVDDATGKQTNPDVYCSAESGDGIHWTKPSLGLHEHQGSREKKDADVYSFQFNLTS